MKTKQHLPVIALGSITISLMMYLIIVSVGMRSEAFKMYATMDPSNPFSEVGMGIKMIPYEVIAHMVSMAVLPVFVMALCTILITWVQKLNRTEIGLMIGCGLVLIPVAVCLGSSVSDWVYSAIWIL